MNARWTFDVYSMTLGEGMHRWTKYCHPPQQHNNSRDISPPENVVMVMMDFLCLPCTCAEILEVLVTQCLFSVFLGTLWCSLWQPLMSESPCAHLWAEAYCALTIQPATSTPPLCMYCQGCVAGGQKRVKSSWYGTVQNKINFLSRSNSDFNSLKLLSVLWETNSPVWRPIYFLVIKVTIVTESCSYDVWVTWCT